MGITGVKWIKKEKENRTNSWSMDAKTYEQFKKDADKLVDAFFGDVMRMTDFVDKKRD